MPERRCWKKDHVRPMRMTRPMGLVAAFVNSGYFDRVADVYSPADLDRLLDLNRARAALMKSLTRLQVASRVQLSGRVGRPRMPPPTA